MTTNEIKEIILDLFRQTKCRVGHIVPERTINTISYKLKIDSRVAIEELIQEGVITYKGGSLPAFALTNLGYDKIYTCRSDLQLKNIVMDIFRNTNCKVGQGYMFRTLSLGVIRNLNPKEGERMIDVLNNMINENYIIVDFENDYPVFLRLTEKGYDYIYN